MPEPQIDTIMRALINGYLCCAFDKVSHLQTKSINLENTGIIFPALKQYSAAIVVVNAAKTFPQYSTMFTCLSQPEHYSSLKAINNSDAPLQTHN